MSVLPNQSSINPTKTLFVKVDATLINTSTLNASYISTSKLYADEANISSIIGVAEINTSTILAEYIFSREIFGDNLGVNTGFISSLTANTGNISTLQTNFNLFSSLEGNSVLTSSIYAETGLISSLGSKYINATQILASNVVASQGNFVQLNTIQIDNGIYIKSDRVEANTISTGYIKARSVSTIDCQVLNELNFGSGRTIDLYATNIRGVNINLENLNPAFPNPSQVYIKSYNAFFNFLSSGSAYIDTLSTNSLFTNFLSAGTINIGSNLNVPDIFCSNITVSNIATTNTLVVDGPALLNDGATITGGVVITGNVDFPVGIAPPLILPPTQIPEYDINGVREVNAGSITIVGGATGNEFFPPYHNASLLTVGNDLGLTSQGVVVINGQLPDPANPGTNLTTALSVYGDVAIGGIDPLYWGTLTSYNGCRLFGENPTGLALEVAGLVEIVGATDITGILTVGPSADILGILTATGVIQATGGINITGGLLQEGGNFTLGLPASGFTGTINTPLTITENLDMSNTNIDNVNTLTARNISAEYVNLTSTLKVPNLSTNNLVVYQDLSGVDVVGGIGFTDISNNLIAGIGLGSSSPYPLGIFSLNSIATYAGESLITNAGINIELTAEGNATLTGLSNASVQSAGDVVVVSGGGTAKLQALNAVDIISDDAGIALNAETGVFINDNSGAVLNVALGNIDGTATGSINLSALNSINLSSITTRVNTLSTIFLQASSITTTNTIQVSTIIADTILGPATANSAFYFGGNSYPKSAGVQLGFFGASGTNSGGFFSQIHTRSTITQTITPDIVGAFSNNIRIQGNVSTQNVFVSTINNKQYPYTSTLGVFGPGIRQSTFSISGTSATTPQVLLSNIRFPSVGNYLISQKNTITKSSGGAGAEPYGSLCVSRGLFPSTFTTEDGFNSIPFINHTNISTFNTYTTTITITNPLSNTRNLTYYDQSGHNYNLRMAIGDLRIKYIPFQGMNPE